MDDATTWIAADARVGGRLETEGAVVIHGRVEGSIRAGGAVTITAEGVAVADIHAERAEVRGTVVGNITATTRIDVAGGARVVGDLRAPVIELAAGATLEGRMDRRHAAPVPTEETFARRAGDRQAVRVRGALLRRPVAPDEAPTQPWTPAPTPPRASAPTPPRASAPTPPRASAPTSPGEKAAATAPGAASPGAGPARPSSGPPPAPRVPTRAKLIPTQRTPTQRTSTRRTPTRETPPQRTPK